MTLMLPVLAFVFASLLVAAGAMWLVPRRAAVLDRRLSEIANARPEGEETDRPYGRAVMDTLMKLGKAAPASVSESSTLRKRLVSAGYRRHEALTVFLGIRVAVALGLFLVAVSPFLRFSLILSLGVCALGYVVPGIVLARMAKRRQHRIRLSLPDALDLLVVSVEAGLGLDQAIQRVADELAFAHIDLSDELRLVNLELRAGTGRVDALRNLGERTGVDDVISLVAMLVQTDKFGTSVSQSLRVHSDTVRTKRRQRAEEAAAKTGVKMVFPLVFCIFPAIWVVTIGPAAIKFVQVLLPLFKQ